MSHPERTEKQNCLNCGAAFQGAYCGRCGQSHIHRTIWQSFIHHIKDQFHYNSKTRNTIKLLLTRPGQLTLEYTGGARMRYVEPIKFYLIVSAMSLLIFYALENHQGYFTKVSNPDAIRLIDSMRIAIQTDTAYTKLLRYANHYSRRKKFQGRYYTLMDARDMYKHGQAHYDSVQHSLPQEQRRNAFERYRDRKLVKIYENYDTEPYNFYSRYELRMTLDYPKSFFVSIPVFFICLLLLYTGRRKTFPSELHGVFTLHFYSTVWMFIMLDSLLCFVFIQMNVEILGLWVAGIMYLGLIPYLYVAMLRFYKGSRVVTMTKTLLLIVLFCISYLLIVQLISGYTFYNMDGTIP